MNGNKVAIIVILLAFVGLILNTLTTHYQGGEIYEAANRAYGLLTKGFNVTISVETTDGRHLRGNLISVKGSTIYLNVNNSILTVGGPQARKEDVKAGKIQVIYHGKVFLYEVAPIEGRGFNVFSSLIPKEYYSVRYSGRIYINGNLTPIQLGKLKYMADYMTYGSVTINAIGARGAIITTNMVPVHYLLKALGEYEIYTYGILYVNSEERNMDLKLIEVRSG
ncbi:hypothetical protein [Thermococcus sp.]